MLSRKMLYLFNFNCVDSDAFEDWVRDFNELALRNSQRKISRDPIEKRQASELYGSVPIISRLPEYFDECGRSR